MRRLIKAGADPTHQEGGHGTSALMSAAAAGHTEAARALLEAGAPWNAIDKSSRCAGDLTSDGGHREAAEAILEAGAQLLPVHHKSDCTVS